MRKKKKKGFTLVELVVVMVIISIIAGVGVHALTRFYELWLFSNYRMEILWSSRNLMQDLTKNIRMVRDKTSIYNATSARFRFFNLGTVSNTDYQYSNNILYKNGTPFTTEVGNFTFTYYKCNKLGACSAPALISDINTVKINFTLTNPRQSVSTESTVNLRNLN